MTDRKWANAIGKMVPTDLLNEALPKTNLPGKKKKKKEESKQAIKQSTTKGMPELY